jgi:hypothetical protein
MQASEMKYLRKVIGKTRRDQMRNTTIKKQLKQESVEVLMEKRTLRWYGHAVRMDVERRPKLVLETRPEGGRGRPRLEWENMWKDWHVREAGSYQKRNDWPRIGKNTENGCCWNPTPNSKREQ